MPRRAGCASGRASGVPEKKLCLSRCQCETATAAIKRIGGKSDENNSTYCEYPRRLYLSRPTRGAAEGGRCMPGALDRNPSCPPLRNVKDRDRSKQSAAPETCEIGHRGEKEKEKGRKRKTVGVPAVAVFRRDNGTPLGRKRPRGATRGGGSAAEGERDGKCRDTAKHPRRKGLRDVPRTAIRIREREKKIYMYIPTYLGPSKWVTNSQQG